MIPASWRLAAAAAAVILLAAGCSAPADDWTAPRPVPTPTGSLGPGFTDPASPPPPEGTIQPVAGSWGGVRAPHGYRVVLLSTGDDSPTRTMVDAVTRWAGQSGASLKTVRITDRTLAIDGIVEALGLHPDLVIGVGQDLVDPLVVVSPHYLQQQFLVVGMQLPEPTVNVTAAVWSGGSARGSEVTNLPTSFDPATFTPQRVDQALGAGVASVMSGLTGIVVWVN